MQAIGNPTGASSQQTEAMLIACQFQDAYGWVPGYPFVHAMLIEAGRFTMIR